MAVKLEQSKADLHAIVGGFHPGERYVLTLKVCASLTDLLALGELASARQISILPDTSLPSRNDDCGWAYQRARQRVIRIRPLFEWQMFEKLLDYNNIESIVPYKEH